MSLILHVILFLIESNNGHELCCYFFPSYCESQDLFSRRTIGSAKEINGLCYLPVNTIKMRQAQIASNNVFSSSIEHQMILWHNRLGHPSFSYFPLMFQCEVCQLSKHYRIYFPTQPHKVTRPFELLL